MFEPTGEFSRREALYMAIRDRPTDELIPWEELPYDQEIARSLRDAVAKTFEREQQRTVVNVRGKGWMIKRGIDQVEVAERQRKRALRHQGRALQIITTTDRREMSGEQRLRTDQVLISTETGYGILRGLSHRKPGIEEIKQYQQKRR